MQERVKVGNGLESKLHLMFMMVFYLVRFGSDNLITAKSLSEFGLILEKVCDIHTMACSGSDKTPVVKCLQ